MTEEQEKTEETAAEEAASGGPASEQTPTPNVNKFITLLIVIAAGAVLLVLVIFGAAFWSVTSRLRSMMQDAPAEFAAVEWETGEPDNIRARMDAAKVGVGEVTLSARELSILLTETVRKGGGDDAKALVELKPPSRISARISQPVDVEGKQRWLNIEISARMENTDDGLLLTYESIKAGEVDLANWLDLELKGAAGDDDPGSLLEGIFPEGVKEASVSPDGILLLKFKEDASTK